MKSLHLKTLHVLLQFSFLVNVPLGEGLHMKTWIKEIPINADAVVVDELH